MSSDQHLLPGESFAKYKERVLDTKSSSFCGAKWYYATVWLDTGQTTACHHPLPHKIDANEVLKNPKLLSNTPQKKKERAEMQKGIQCKGCDYCWRVENLKANKISDRVYKSVLYTDDELQKALEDWMNPENADSDTSSTPAANSKPAETKSTDNATKKTDVAEAFDDLFNN